MGQGWGIPEHIVGGGGGVEMCDLHLGHKMKSVDFIS